MGQVSLHDHINSLPALVGEIGPTIAETCQALFSQDDFKQVQEIVLFGCGDSHHAAVEAELAFHQLAGVRCRATRAMHYSRYLAGYLPAETGRKALAIAVSASGSVSRTVEALRMAREAGAITVAITGDHESPLARTAERLLHVPLPSFTAAPAGLVIPGARSYVASQLGLLLAAIQLGKSLGHLDTAQTNLLVGELIGLADNMDGTIAVARPPAAELATRWADGSHYVFCGAGPNYGTALFCAAKLLEASGDTAIGQDLEEWAHLQYFGREIGTPTFIISAGGWDEDRALEVAAAAAAIRRRMAIIAPDGSAIAATGHKEALLPVATSPRECFSPLLTSLPGLLFAAYRAQYLGETYFRGFSGGRRAEGGGGKSRIRTSHQVDHSRR